MTDTLDTKVAEYWIYENYNILHESNWSSTKSG